MRSGFVLLPACVWLAACVVPAGPQSDVGETPDGGDASAPDAPDASPFDPASLPQGRPPARAPANAVVISVIDGDTFNVRFEDGSTSHVRFLSIDAPELYPSSGAPECLAAQARVRATELTPPGSPVWLTFDTTERDRYGRLLAHVFAGDAPAPVPPDWVNLELVLEGYARAYVFSDNETYRSTFEGAEREARSANRGLWGTCGP